MYYDGIISKPDLDEYFIEHHGIKGQKWGVRNGPPYPLDSSKSTGKRLKTTSKNSKRKNEFAPELLLPAFIIAWDAAILTIGIGDLVKKSKPVSKLIGKHRDKKLSELRATETIDKKSGLHLKNKEMTEKQDMKAVNRDRGTFEDEGTYSNCTWCTTAYDLRRRGFDVYAGKTIKGFTNSEIASWYKGNNKFKDIKIEQSDLTSNSASTRKVIDTLQSEPNGSRGNITFAWRGTYSGHSIAYQVKDGKVTFIDAQAKIMYKNKNAYNLMSRVDPESVSYLRTDNLTPDYAKLKKLGVVK